MKNEGRQEDSEGRSHSEAGAERSVGAASTRGKERKLDRGTESSLQICVCVRVCKKEGGRQRARAKNKKRRRKTDTGTLL